MATNLNNIIAAIKEVALANGFTKVEELKINDKSNADTELDKLFIRLNSLTYDKFRIDMAEEDYRLELIIIINCTENPISNLKAKMDLLLNKMFTTNNLLVSLVQGEKIKLVDANLTNDRDLYSKYGGEGVTLRMDIKNVNAFSLTSYT
tara:strand:+ start:260 stop:706 length:447 start_codon:yes stop_codon:yes gene_type:complete